MLSITGDAFAPAGALVECIDLMTDKVVTGDHSPKPKKYINVYKQRATVMKAHDLYFVSDTPSAAVTKEPLKNDGMQGDKELTTELYEIVQRGGSDEVDAALRVFQRFLYRQ